MQDEVGLFHKLPLLTEEKITLGSILKRYYQELS